MDNSRSSFELIDKSLKYNLCPLMELAYHLLANAETSFRPLQM